LVRWTSGLSGLAALIGAGALGASIQPTGETVTLHRNIYFGVDLVGPWFSVYGWPLGGLVVTAMNTIVAYFLDRRGRLLADCLLVGSVVLNLLVATEAILIVISNR